MTVSTTTTDTIEGPHRALLDWLEGQIVDDQLWADVLDRVPDLTDVDAFRLQLALTRRWMARGHRHIGYKVAGASRGIQTQVHIDGPVVGCLLQSAMYSVYPEEEPIAFGTSTSVRVEPEIAVLLKHDLAGPGVTMADVYRAIEGYFPALEIVATSGNRGSRSYQMQIATSKFTGGGIVLGDPLTAPHGIDLRLEGMVLSLNGIVQGSATGVEVLGHPLRAVALVANKIGQAGGRLTAGMVVMTGSLIANVPVAPGDHLQVEFTRVGSVRARFVA